MASLRRQQAAGCRGMVGRGYSVGVGCVGDPAEDGGTVPLRPSAPVGSLVVARELAPAGSRSDPNRFTACLRQVAVTGFGAAAQPSGSKLPRHASPPVLVCTCLSPSLLASTRQSYPLRCFCLAPAPL